MMNKKLLSLMTVMLAGTAMFAQSTDSLNYTGGMQTWTVPCGVTSITVTCYGAEGGDGAQGDNTSTGGLGGFGSMSSGVLAVTPGDVLNIYVGGAGSAPVGGFNGGANGGSDNAGGGGGATDIRLNSTSASARVIVGAGGGGGGRGGCETGGVNGGNGGSGDFNGANGTNSPDGGGGFGGTASGGSGPAGIGCGGFLGLPGGATSDENGAVGGGGQACCCFSVPSVPGGGGGGGGFIGGGGGGGGSAGTTGCSGNNKGGGGGGGGGSNYTGGVTSPTIVAAARSGDGAVYITYGDPTPAPGAISGNTNICELASGTYSISAVPLATSYTWTVPAGLMINSGQGTTSISVTATGTTGGNITVSATNACGTSDSTVLAVTIDLAPVMTVSADTTICAGASVTLTATGAATYLWSPTSATTSVITDAPAATTTYTVGGLGANGCANALTTTVTVNQLPTVTTNTSALTLCNGDFATLFGAGALTYSWTGGITDNVPFVPASTMTYTVTGTDVNGCDNTATATITVNPLPTVTTNLSSITVCAGDTVTLFGQGAVTYSWSGGISDNVGFIPASTATYTVTGTDANGCMNTASASVTVNPLPTVTGTASDNSVCVDDGAVVLTGTPAAGTWSGPGVTGTSFSPTAAGIGSQTATYTFTDANSCTNSAQTVIVVSACVGVNEGNTLASGVTVFPNPTSGLFTINVNANVGDMVIEVVDMEGRVVFSSNEKNVQAGFSKPVSLTSLPNGVYMVNLYAGKEHATHAVTLTK
jgi:hypothetical protein